MTTKTTTHWIDFYSAVLENLAEKLADPKKTYKKLGILDEYNKIKAEGEAGNAAPMPEKMSIEKYQELVSSWRRVKKDIKTFGVECSESIEFAPTMAVMASVMWQKNPWLEVYHEKENRPLVFRGRDAYTALGFFNFYIQHSETDPVAHMKKVLSAQGINKENFRERVPLSEIANPWEEDSQNKE